MSLNPLTPNIVLTDVTPMAQTVWTAELFISQAHRQTWKPDSALQLFFVWYKSVIFLASKNKWVLSRKLAFQTQGRAVYAGLAKPMASKQKASHRLLVTTRQEKSSAQSGVEDWHQGSQQLTGWSSSARTPCGGGGHRICSCLELTGRTQRPCSVDVNRASVKPLFHTKLKGASHGCSLCALQPVSTCTWCRGCLMQPELCPGWTLSLFLSAQITSSSPPTNTCSNLMCVLDE